MATPWIIEKLNNGHQRQDFDCGKLELDDFIKRLAGQYEKRHRLAQTYVATTPGEQIVRGFYAICTGSISKKAIPAGSRNQLRVESIPTLHLGRLAVDRSAQRTGLGRMLLFHFLSLAHAFSQNVGVHAVDVLLIDDDARGFYEKHQFLPLEENPNHLYLPMKTVAKLFESDGA